MDPASLQYCRRNFFDRCRVIGNVKAALFGVNLGGSDVALRCIDAGNIRPHSGQRFRDQRSVAGETDSLHRV